MHNRRAADAGQPPGQTTQPRQTAPHGHLHGHARERAPAAQPHSRAAPGALPQAQSLLPRTTTTDLAGTHERGPDARPRPHTAGSVTDPQRRHHTPSSPHSTAPPPHASHSPSSHTPSPHDQTRPRGRSRAPRHTSSARHTPTLTPSSRVASGRRPQQLRRHLARPWLPVRSPRLRSPLRDPRALAAGPRPVTRGTRRRAAAPPPGRPRAREAPPLNKATRRAGVHSALPPAPA